ncbi:hypothetical protein ACJRO7_013682 [Eucalyptus globulus]|uniref:Uncharacterized protein n=1 Tax=Eucalyptus globulus TaxID=34317 RepID=A0ABD3L3P5_EUCGL
MQKGTNSAYIADDHDLVTQEHDVALNCPACEPARAAYYASAAHLLLDSFFMYVKGSGHSLFHPHPIITRQSFRGEKNVMVNKLFSGNQLSGHISWPSFNLAISLEAS